MSNEKALWLEEVTADFVSNNGEVCVYACFMVGLGIFHLDLLPSHLLCFFFMVLPYSCSIILTRELF